MESRPLVNRPRVVARIELGICYVCNDREAMRGRQRCKRCAEHENARNRALYWMRKNLGIPTPPEILLQDALGAARRRRARKEEGKCIVCGVPVMRFQRCCRCRAAASEAKKRWRQKRKMAA